MLIYILITPKIHEALYYAESKDRYNRLCNESSSNSEARHGMNYTAASLSETDIQVLNNLFKNYVPFVPPRLLHDIDYISIATLMPSADGGFPHTRPERLICFPQSASLPSLQTFIHELWHIHQRKYPDLWKRLYLNIWGFKEWRDEGDAKLPEELRKQIRINPDTLGINGDRGLYCWKNEWVPLPIFLSPSRPKMNDCAIWFWNIRTMKWRQSPPEAWTAFFSSPLVPSSANEHPNELSAYMLSSIEYDMRSPPAFVALKDAIGRTAFHI
jgi:hypothetical protein